MHSSRTHRQNRGVSGARQSRKSNGVKTAYRKSGGFYGRPGAVAARRGGRRKMPSFDPSRFINTNPVSINQEVYVPKHTFKSFGLTAGIDKNLAALGMVIPTPIQDNVIPEILRGRDVLGLAETGTGKTAAFLLPLIQKTILDTKRRTLILVPMRELAIQINDEFRKLSRGSELFSVACVGGASIYPQINALRRTNHFVIGTPGRIRDLIKRGDLDAGNMTTVVLDEADRMLDMGFINDMRNILATTPTKRETLLFSATMSTAAQKLVKDFLRDPIAVSVKKKAIADNIEQDIVHYDHDSKFETLAGLLKDSSCERVLVFCSMKHGAERLARELGKGKIDAESIHGNKNHNQRQRALQKFRSGLVRVLVATDIAARGIHIENITHVINYDLPSTFEDYVHRIGRTGRGAMRGKALTFVAGA